MDLLFGSSQSKNGEQNSSGFDLNSLLGSVSASSQNKHSSGSKPESFSKPQSKSSATSQSTSKLPSNSSHPDAGKSRESKDSSQRGRDGNSNNVSSHQKESSHNDKGPSKSKAEDYNPLSSRTEKSGNDRNSSQHDSSFEGKIKKKIVDSSDKNDEDSFKIKKNPAAQPSSPKIKKVAPSPTKPKVNPPPQNRPTGNTSTNKSSTPHSSSQGPSKDQRPLSSQKSDRPNGAIPKKPLNGTSQSSSKLPSRPTSSSPGPSKSMTPKPMPNGVKPSSMNKSIPPKGSTNSSAPKPSGSRPVSQSPRPPMKPGSVSADGKPSGPPAVMKKPGFVVPQPKPGAQRPGSSQPPKPVAPGRTPNGAGLSQEALRKQKEERMRREAAAAKGKEPMGSSNLVKRPQGAPLSKHEPEIHKKPKLTIQEQKKALNSVFKGNSKPHRRYAESDDDDYDEKDSFIDDGEDEQSEEARNELGKIFKGYRTKVQKTKHFEDDTDDMEVGFDRIQRELEWSAKVGKIEDEEEYKLIQREQEEEENKKKKKKKRLMLD